MLENIPLPAGTDLNYIKNLYNIQPLDRGSFRYILKFTEYDEEYPIDSPIGFNTINIGVEQEEEGYARHLTFGDSATFKFTHRIKQKYGHQFERIVQEFKERGHESRIEIHVYDNDNFVFSAELQTENVETNFLDYFTCPVNIQSYKKIIESREEVEVNVLDNLSIDNRPITPLTLTDLRLKPKQIQTISEYSTPDEVTPLWIKQGTSVRGFIFGIKLRGEINNSLTYTPTANIDDYGVIEGDYNWFYGTLIQTAQPARINIVLENVRANVFTLNPPASPEFRLRMCYRISQFDDNDNVVNVIVGETVIPPETASEQELFISHWESGIIDLPENSKITFYIFYNRSADRDTQFLEVFPGGIIRFESIDIYPESRTQSAPLIDLGKQIIKSITNDEVSINNSIFESGRYAPVHALSGYLVRSFPPFNPLDRENEENKKFIATWSGFVNCLRNIFNCDWQLIDNKINILQHQEFYKDVEAYRFEKPISIKKFKIKNNERIQKNKLEYNYSTYEDNKDNTIDSIHTESSYYLPDTRLSDTESKEISYIADAYKIEYARREELIEEGTRSKVDDDNIYLIDTYKTNNAMRMNATTEYAQATNVFSADTMYNLRLSLKRLLIDNFRYYLSNLTQLIKGSIVLKNTYFKNNGLGTTRGVNDSFTSPLQLVENADIQREVLDQIAKPLITDKVYELSLPSRFKFREMFNMVNAIQQTNGYVSIPIEEYGSDLKLYITELEYDNYNEKLNITAEEKYNG